jgi:mannose/fructose/N-acetylgalactosamine-specific phosphotransferase system component IIC
MISRPIVAGPIVGLLLGDLHTGIIGGAFVELLWSDRAPIGTYVPPDDSLVAVIVVGASVLMHKAIGAHARELTSLSMLLYVPLGKVSQIADTYLIRANDRLSQRAVEFAEKGDWRSMARQHLIALARSGVVNILLIAVALSAGLHIMLWLYPLLTPPALHALTLIYCLLPLMGVAVALYAMRLENTTAIFSGVCLAVMILLEFVHVS